MDKDTKATASGVKVESHSSTLHSKASFLKKRSVVLILILAVIGVGTLLYSLAATPVLTKSSMVDLVAKGTVGLPALVSNGEIAFKNSSAPSGTGTSTGQKWNATNTGLAGAGVSEASLTAVNGSVNYGTANNGQTISGKSYNGRVTIDGSNITIKNCKAFVGGANTVAFWVNGDNVRIEGCTITSPSGKSMYEPIIIETSADGTVITGNDVSKGENLITTYGTNVTISNNYLHDPSNISDTSGHVDAIEVYGGSNVLIDSNRILELGFDDAPVNVAPYRSDNNSVKNLTVSRNFLDGGSHPILVDLQSSGVIQNTRIIGNVMGGHQYWSGDVTGYGHYHALLNSQNRPTVQTDAQLAANSNAIMWPTGASDANTNYWGESQDLSPNKNGQIVQPAY